jgi:hypothetical protein
MSAAFCLLPLLEWPCFFSQTPVPNVFVSIGAPVSL